MRKLYFPQYLLIKIFEIMKNKYLNTILIFLTISSLSIIEVSMSGCDKTEQFNSTTSESKKDSTIKNVSYTCPMHPEFVSANKNDKCPKCGMSLVEKKENSINENHSKLHSDKYTLKLTTVPEHPKTGEDITLNFSLLNNETKQQIKNLVTVHEKIFHLIIVSSNLTYFDHLHPEMNADGSLSVKTKFENGGKYILFADLTPEGESSNQVFDIPLEIKGNPVENTIMTPRNTFETDGFTATMSTDPTDLIINKSTEIVVNIKKNGKHVTDLKNYLGALGHMVIISEDGSKYLHVHPMSISDESKEHDHSESKEMKMDSDKITKSGPSVVFHTEFHDAGIYKVFAQFNPGGKLLTTNFVIKVK